MVEIVNVEDLKPYYRHDKARLAEGITYIAETNTLYWVDIYEGQLHRLVNLDKDDEYAKFDIRRVNYDASIGNIEYPTKDTTVRESCGVIFPTHTDKDIVYFGSKFGIGKASFKTGKWGYIALYSQCKDIEPERALRLRSNDGNISPDGKHIIIGVMNDFGVELKDEGCILKISFDSVSKKSTVEMLWDHVRIPNAIHWNKDASKIYITDSLAFTVQVFDWDNVNNTIPDVKNSHKLFDTRLSCEGFESPEPDGSDADEQNSLIYQCVWSTSKVHVYSMIDGKLVREFHLPKETPRLSCCCIVGKDLFVTVGNSYITDEDHNAAKAQGKFDNVGGSIYRIKNALADNDKITSSKKHLQW